MASLGSQRTESEENEGKLPPALSRGDTSARSLKNDKSNAQKTVQQTPTTGSASESPERIKVEDPKREDEKSAQARGAAAPVNRTLLERLRTLEDRRATEKRPESAGEAQNVPKTTRTARDERKQKLLDEFRENGEKQGRREPGRQESVNLQSVQSERGVKGAKTAQGL